MNRPLNNIYPFTIIAKPVSGICNLNCKYCYYVSKPKELYPQVKSFLMTDETLSSFIKQYIEAMPQYCSFHWQGGEPLLAGKDFFKKVVSLQNTHRLPNQIITNALQTNGTLLDEEWCDFFRENHFLIGISIDGAPQWHDYYRKDRNGNNTFYQTWAGLELLEKTGVDFNVLVTLNNRNISHGGNIYRYFTNRNIRHLQFIPIVERTKDGRIADFSCNAEQYGKFLLETFEIWFNRDIGKVSVRFFDNVIHTILYGQSEMCCYARRCANAFVLEFNGDLYVCDHFVFPEWKIGNILETPLVELLQSSKIEEFAKLKTELPDVCKDCEFLNYCWSGCPKHHIPSDTSAKRVNYLCQSYKMFFSKSLDKFEVLARHLISSGVSNNLTT